MTPDGSVDPSVPYAALPRANGYMAPSAGLAGIDALHSFITDPRPTAPYGPESTTTNQPAVGGYGNYIPHAGPYNTRQGYRPTDPKGWDQSINGSRVESYYEEQNQNVTDLDSGTGDITRPRDPRNYSIPANRPTTQLGGPQMSYTVRSGPQLWGRFREAFFHGRHGSYAFTPTLRPSPMQLGDGVGTRRFRPTRRITPDPLASQVHTQELGDTASSVFATSSIPSYW